MFELFACVVDHVDDVGYEVWDGRELGRVEWVDVMVCGGCWWPPFLEVIVVESGI